MRQSTLHRTQAPEHPHTYKHKIPGVQKWTKPDAPEKCERKKTVSRLFITLKTIEVDILQSNYRAHYWCHKDYKWKMLTIAGMHILK